MSTSSIDELPDDVHDLGCGRKDDHVHDKAWFWWRAGPRGRVRVVMRQLSRRQGAVWWLVASGVFVVVAVVGLVLSRQYAHGVHLYEALTHRGVQTSAAVESSHYDPSGGDPDGWTSDVVSFKDRDGRSFVTTVGHHGANTEANSGKIEVIYDSADPTRVKALEDFEQSSASQGLLMIAYAGSIVAVIIGCAGLLVWLLRGQRSVDGLIRNEGVVVA